jgi:hypothetical protein
MWSHIDTHTKVQDSGPASTLTCIRHTRMLSALCDSENINMYMCVCMCVCIYMYIGSGFKVIQVSLARLHVCICDANEGFSKYVVGKGHNCGYTRTDSRFTCEYFSRYF